MLLGETSLFTKPKSPTEKSARYLGFANLFITATVLAISIGHSPSSSPYKVGFGSTVSVLENFLARF